MARTTRLVLLRPLVALAAAGGTGWALVTTAAATAPHIGAPGQVGFDAMVTLGCALLGLAILCWLGISAIATVLGRLPGISGRAAEALADRLAPPAVRRALLTTLGLSMLTGPAFAVPASSFVIGEQQATISTVGSGDVPSLDRPVPPADTTHPVHIPPRPQRRPAEADPVDDRPAQARPIEPPARKPVVVRPGDSLWKIAGRSLGREARDQAIADAWPLWYAANRHIIGPDPDLLLPGQVLRPPG